MALSIVGSGRSEWNMLFDETSRLEHLNKDECWKRIRQKSIGRLAVSIANKPDIFPVNYVASDEGEIVVRTAAGLKLAAATLGAGVAFEVGAYDESTHAGWSVVIRGTATEIERLDDVMKAQDMGIEPWAEGNKSRFIRIHADVVSGREVPAL
ncbi:MAG: pyridoxamine 5'-phosphate oxidase family protein [Actinobacteria bacterium]|nr:pyridoxamine 5'-phosphate oxidase family protein [Actinomycetota bacterium]